MKEDANGKYLRDPKSTKNLKNLVLYQYFKRDGISLLCVGWEVFFSVFIVTLVIGRTWNDKTYPAAVNSPFMEKLLVQMLS